MLMIAHRGSSKSASLENSLPGIKEAISSGAQWLEIDVRMDGNGKLVLGHDFDLMRSYQQQKLVRETSQHQLFLFSDFLKLIKEEGIHSIIELKFDPSSLVNDHFERSVFEISKNHLNQVMFSSFSPLVVRRLSSLGVPQKNLAQLLDSSFKEEMLPWLPMNKISYVHISKTLADKGYIKFFQNLGKKVFLYTIKNSDEVVKYQKLNSDGLICDDFPNLIQATNKKNAAKI